VLHRQFCKDRNHSRSSDVTADKANNADAVEAGVPPADFRNCGRHGRHYRFLCIESAQSALICAERMSAATDSQRMEKIVSLCKRRGFIFQSSEIYGGLNGLWDYGPLGVELKRNLKNYWWRVMVHERNDIVGMDGSILMNRAVWQASGHEDTFTDPMVDCRSCKARLRADQLIDKKGIKQCPVCGGKDLTTPRAFNLMFKTFVGAAEDESNVTYLRPETAQSIFVQFKNVLEVSRKKLPFGIAQIG